jgi:RHS repeat-associated protein
MTPRVNLLCLRTPLMPVSRQTQRPSRSPAADLAFSRTLLLASDLQQTILAELDRSGPNGLAYTPYGSQSSPLAAGTRLGFNGQLRERPTGWYHLGNGYRVYNPGLMRFHSPDRLSPFGKGGLHAYAYCGGCPVNRTDPSGASWLALLGQGVGSALNMIFAGAAINRSAAAIVSGIHQPMRMRIGNMLSFWGGAASVPFRAVGVPAAVVAKIPDAVMSIVSTVGTIGGQGLTGAGAAMQNSVSAGQWWVKAGQNGQSRGRVLWEATKEASGWNLIRGQAQGQVPRRSPDVALREVVVTVREPS